MVLADPKAALAKRWNLGHRHKRVRHLFELFDFYANDPLPKDMMAKPTPAGSAAGAAPPPPTAVAVPPAPPKNLVLPIRASVGLDGKNDPGDVSLVAARLTSLGYRPTGLSGSEVAYSLSKLLAAHTGQRFPNGTVQPGSGVAWSLLTQPAGATASGSPAAGAKAATAAEAPKAAAVPASTLKPAPVAPPRVTSKTPLPAGFSDEKLAAATAWGIAQRYHPDSLRGLQGAIGAEVTGVYDRATAIAVYLDQDRDVRKGSSAGRADVGHFSLRGAICFHQDTTVAIPDIAAVQAAAPDGVAVACWTKYVSEKLKPGVFLSAAKDYAEGRQAVAPRGGKLALGVPIAIDNVAQVVDAVRTVHASLLAGWRLTAPKDKDGKPVGDPPAWCKVRNLALFCHGMEDGISLDSGNSFGGSLHTSGKSNVAAFASAISDATTTDVRIQVFSCNTGRDVEILEKENARVGVGSKTRSKQDNKDLKKGVRESVNWGFEGAEPVEGERHGAGSFADLLNQALEATGKTSTTVGHNLLGHTTENYAARFFGRGAGAGTGAGGVHVFDVLYDAAFIDAETRRLFPAVTAATFPACRKRVRDAMWDHYRDAVQKENKRSNKHYAKKLGSLIAVAPDEAKAILRATWTTWASQPGALDEQEDKVWKHKTADELIADGRRDRLKKKKGEAET